MSFEDFIAKEQVKKSEMDEQLAKALIKTADSDLNFLNSLKVDQSSARKIVSNYYDTLRSILEAIAILEGYKIFSHEAFTSYLIKKGEDSLAHKFDRFRKIRNGINYYGKDIEVNEAIDYSKEIIKLIQVLKEKFLKKVR